MHRAVIVSLFAWRIQDLRTAPWESSCRIVSLVERFSRPLRRTAPAKLLGLTTPQIKVFAESGRFREQHKTTTLRLAESKETVKVGEIEF